MHPLEKVKLQMDDPNCRGVTSRNNRVRFDAKDSVVEVPAIEAQRIVQSGGPASLYRKSWGVGIDLKALEQEKKRRDVTCM